MYFDRIQLLVYVCNILQVIIHKKCKENPQKCTNFNVFGHFSKVLKVFLGVTSGYCWNINWPVTSMPLLYTARNSQMSSYEAFSNNMFSIQAHQACVHQRLILAQSHDPTHLAHLVQNPYKVMCSKCTVTSFSRNTQCFLIAAHTYPSQRHART